MKRKFFWAMIIFFICASIGYAHPPENMKLAYDQQKNILSIEARHVTKDLKNHYIRKVIVTVNDEPPQPIYLHRQNDPTMFEFKYNVDAKVGDTISVKLFCSKGGVLSKSITIEKETDDQPEE